MVVSIREKSIIFVGPGATIPIFVQRCVTHPEDLSIQRGVAGDIAPAVTGVYGRPSRSRHGPCSGTGVDGGHPIATPVAHCGR